MRVLTVLAILVTSVPAQVQNLRITEVDPRSDRVEITNFGPAFATPRAYPFCHRFNYSSSIPSGTFFAAGQVRVFTVNGLADADSDLWLYADTPFGNGANIVHGLKWGPAANIGRSALAATVGRWPSGSTFAPDPGVGHTLRYDGAGFEAHDWAVDASPSLGSVDPTATGSAPSTLGVPSGIQTFEPLGLGDDVTTIAGWARVDTSAQGEFDVRVIGDVNGQASPLPTPFAGRWLRVHDTDGGSAQNRFYSDFQNTGVVADSYRLDLLINPLALPGPGAANRPRLTIQHMATTGVPNVWGIELDTSGARLVVLPDGGTAATASLGAVALGAWTQVSIEVDFVNGAVTGRFGAGAATLPINLASTVDPTSLRFCYRGEGTGNVATMLMDDIGLEFDLPLVGNVSCRAIPGGAAIDLSVENGGAGNWYQHILAVQQANIAPSGSFFGIEPTLPELRGQLFFAPFFGTLNANGSALDTVTFPGIACPLGVSIDRVTLEFDITSGTFVGADLATTANL